MKKIFSLFCALAMILSVSAAPAVQGKQLPRNPKAPQIQLAEKAQLGNVIAPKQDLKASPMKAINLDRQTAKAPKTLQVAKSQRVIKEDTVASLYWIDFTEGQGTWTIHDFLLEDSLQFVWQQDSRYGMKASAYSGGAHASESWLVSPSIEFTNVKDATLHFSHARKFGNNEQLHVLATGDNGNHWNELAVSEWPDGSSWTYVDASADLTQFVGAEYITLAFVYTSSAEEAATWEIKTVEVIATVSDEPIEPTVPTVDILAQWFDLESQLVVAMKFDQEVCNPIVFVGTHAVDDYGSWINDPDLLPHFYQINGFEDWWVVAVPYAEGAQGKPVQLMNDNSFNWDFQSGDPYAWIHMGGNEANLTWGYAGEANVEYPTAGAYIYELAYWKNGNDPCSTERQDFTINMFAPDACPEMWPAIIGTFNNWQEGVPMSRITPTNGDPTYYSITINDIPGGEFKFKDINDTDWSNQLIFYYQEDSTAEGGWYYFNNFVLPDATEGTELWFDFSDNNLFGFEQCVFAPITPTGDTISIVFAGSEQVSYQYFNDGDWYFVADNGEHHVQLDFFNYNPASPVGSYSEIDLWQSYSIIARYETDTTWWAFSIETAKIEVFEQDNNYVLWAELFATDGNVYEVTMISEKPAVVVPTRTEDLVFENARLDLYEGAWQIRGYDNTGSRYLNVAAYNDQVAGEYILSQLAFARIAVFTSDTSYVWYDAAQAQLSVNYDEEAQVATIQGAMIATYEEDAVEFLLNVTANLYVPEVPNYDATDADFVAAFTSYDVYATEIDTANGYGYVALEAINDALQYIDLTIILPQGATGLVPGVYPITSDADYQTTYYGGYGENGLYGSFAAQLVEEDGSLYITVPFWYIQDGNVIVNEDLSITVDAINTYGRAIKAFLGSPYNPVQILNVAEAVALGENLGDNEVTADNYIVRGYVANAYDYNANYGNQTFFMSDDPNATRGDFEAYRCVLDAPGVVVGDIVEVFGPITRYVNASGNATVEINGGTVTIIGHKQDSELAQCGDSLYWTLNDGVLDITGTGAMWDNMYEVWNTYEITQLNLPEGLTYIGQLAFYGAYNLKDVLLPSTLVEVGYAAFAESGLQSLYIPSSVQLLGSYAFAYCYELVVVQAMGIETNLYNTTFTDSYICALAAPLWFFHGIDSRYIQTLYITAGYPYADYIEKIGLSRQYLNYLNLYGLEGNYIPAEAFRNCYALETVVLPENVQVIEQGAFQECKMLTNITFPAALTEIGPSAFEDCRSLPALNFEEGSQLWRVGNWAFYNCHNLQSIALPEGVTHIGDGAFYGCVYAEDMQLPASVATIGDNAFALCTRLNKMEVNAILPPSILAKTFFEVSREAPVYVPDESVDIYKQDQLWNELNIVGRSQMPHDIQNVNAGENVQKVVRDGQLFIIRGNRTFTTTGAEVK